MKEPKVHQCLNCESTQEYDFKFCPNCGQKNTDGKITFSELWSEFQDAVFNVESRTWKTLTNIFKPGKLTLKYFSGKHRQYVHPLRVLIITSLLVIIALSFQDVQSSTNHGYVIKDRILENYERQRTFRILNHIIEDTKKSYSDTNVAAITDSILHVYNDSLNSLLAKYGDKYGDSININHYIRTGFEGDEIISKHDFLTKNEDQLVEKYKPREGIFQRIIFKQKIKYIKDESQLASSMVERLTLAILFMMPCVALILYLLYVRRKIYYIENLIFTFHVHSFAFIVITCWILGWSILPEWSRFIALLLIEIYLFIAMKRVYQQGVFKTSIKFLILNISYFFLLLLFILITFWASFLLL